MTGRPQADPPRPPSVASDAREVLRDSPVERARAALARRPILLLLLLATGLRLPFATRAPLSIDEAITADRVRRAHEAATLREALSDDLDAPLLTLLNLELAGGLGVSALSLRLPSVVAGIASVPLAYRLAALVVDRELALQVGLLAAASPFLVFHAQEARPYALLLCTSLLFLVVYLETLESRGRPRSLALRTIGLALGADLVVLSHYVGIVFLASFYAVMAVHHLSHRRTAALASDLASLVLAPLLPLAIAGLLRPDLGGFLQLGVDLLSGTVTLLSRKVGDLDPYSVIVGQMVYLGVGFDNARLTGFYLLYFVLLVLPFVVNRRRRQPTSLPSWLGPAWLAPVVGSGIADALAGTHLLYYPRAYIPTTPLLMTWWLGAVREWRAPARLRRWYLALFLVPMLVSGLLLGIGSPWHPEYSGRARVRELVARIEAVEQPGDVILVHHGVMASYVRSLYRGPNRIAPLATGALGGRPLDGVEPRVVRPRARLIVVSNRLASITDDPDALVDAELDATRPVLARIACDDVSPMVCERVTVYGPRRDR